jgi:dethiobiotin synthetase
MELWMPCKSIFLTGTDTGVGKTLISAALLHALGKHYPRVVGMKPVAAGLIEVDGQWVSEDVLALRAASTDAVPPELDNPVALTEPMAPHIAAQREGRSLQVAELMAAHQQLQTLADVIVVEGAGGWRVPLNDHQTLADFAKALGAPVVLVVGMRLGCLSHALLTAEAIRADGLDLIGWVANHIDPDMAQPEENVASLRLRLGAPLLATVPWQPGAPDARHISIDLPANWQGN